MNLINEMIEILKIFIIIGGILRITYCFIKMIGREEEISPNKLKIKNTIIFIIFAESVLVLRDLIISYF